MLSLFVRVIHAPLYETGMPQASRTKKRIGTQVLSEVIPESCVLSASILLGQNVSLRMPLFLCSQWFNMIVTCCYNCFVSITCNFTGVFFGWYRFPRSSTQKMCTPISFPCDHPHGAKHSKDPHIPAAVWPRIHYNKSPNLFTHLLFRYSNTYFLIFFFFWSSVISLDINTRGLKFAFVTLD